MRSGSGNAGSAERETTRRRGTTPWKQGEKASSTSSRSSSTRAAGAYTDGSKCENTKSYAWAVHFVTDGGAVQFSGAIVDTGKDSSGSFSAEFTAALMAARIAREAGFSKVVIHHDLVGVNTNDKGVMKSKKADMVSCRQEMAEETKLIKVSFVKCSSKPSASPAHKFASQSAKHAKQAIA